MGQWTGFGSDKEAGQQEVQTEFWYRGSKDDRHTRIASRVNRLRTSQIDRIHADLALEYIYENTGGRRHGVDKMMTLLRTIGYQGASVNVARSVVDTLTGKIAQRNPAIKCTADRANYSYKQKSTKLTRFLRAKMREAEIQRTDPRVIRDALVVGTGMGCVSIRHDEIAFERVPRRELFVDEYEARYGTPRSMHRVRKISREVLAHAFHDVRGAEAVIGKTTAAPYRDEDHHFGYSLGTAEGANMVELFESYHLPSGPDAGDGVWCFSTEAGVLEEGPYEFDSFPFGRLLWKHPTSGYWGKSLVSELAPLQRKLDEVLDRVMTALYWGANLKVFVNRSSDINSKHLAAIRPAVIKTSGLKPIYESANPVSEQDLRMLDWLISRMYEMAGVNQAMAGGANPLGADASGVSRMEFYDQHSERYFEFENDYAHYRLDLSEIMLHRMKEIHERKKARKEDYMARWQDRNAMIAIKWEEVDMRRDQFVLQLEPSNFIPDTRAGKLRAVEELSKFGLISQEWMPELFDEPDLKEAMRIQNAPLSLIRQHMEQLGDVELEMAEDGEVKHVIRQAPMPIPTPMMDLEGTMAMAKAEWNYAKANKYPEVVCERYRRYIELAKAERDKQKQAMSAAQPAAAGMDPAMAGGGPPPGAEGMTPPGLPPTAAPEGLPGQALPGAPEA